MGNMDPITSFLPKVIKPKKYNWLLLHLLGLTFSLMNRIRHSVVRYSTSRPFSTAQIDRSIDYCLDVVYHWERFLRVYTEREKPFYDQHVLEIGPGPDLGTGVILLALGAKSYCAIDRYELATRTPAEFYERLFKRIRHFPECEKAMKVFHEFEKNGSDRFTYICDSNFNLDAVQSDKYQILITQAVLEHLHDLRAVFATLRHKLSRGGFMIHEVDLSTHTRFIRDLDPLNILRYPDTLYHLLRFSESPNRLRMDDYASILNELGYENVKTFPIKILDLDYTKWVAKHISHRFKGYSHSELKVLSFYLLASMN